MSFAPGDLIGDYRVLGLLGRGGMGRVFRVRNVITNRLEAMKMVLEEDPGLAERFLMEIRVHAALEHPNIAALRTALRAGERVLMVMELVEGASLEDKLRAGPMGAPEAAGIGGQVLAALDYAHAHGVVHRDIKPANILITPEGVAKLTDFGIARVADARRLTGTGAALGSLSYMAPEQIQGGPVDGRTDIYALGVTLYEAVSGRRPFQGENEYAIMSAHLAGDPAPPPVLAEVIMKALAREPAARSQSAAEFRVALDAPAAPAPLEQAVLEAARKRLALYLGPIARVIVDRAARRSRTPRELYDALASELPTDGERKAFLAAGPK